MASSYNNSSEEQTELRRLHIKLISEINDDLDQNSIEYEKLFFHFGTYVPSGLIANKSSLDKLKTLCTRNIITPGENYEKLKQICRDSGNDTHVNTIEKYEKEMEKVRTRHRNTGPQEAEKKHTDSKRKFTALETEQKEVECVSFAFYPPPIESGGGYSFGVVRPSIRPSEFRFRSSSLQLLAGIQRNFMRIINIKRRCAYRRLVPVRPFNSELWPLISYVVCI
ncbi:uncharacterized protein LOC132750909 [Ruditapes philippinarum]|uniref:uncharacterized protein LOC132750909 n=1 Tax=Ruditapes philippinarum TaxID=129788 RepID=UPI00295AFE64|nr:uncharacterized protein LOC132750909 [Ruditapes philippinarum]